MCFCSCVVGLVGRGGQMHMGQDATAQDVIDCFCMTSGTNARLKDWKMERSEAQ